MKKYYFTNDVVFKKIFADDKNRDILLSLLSAVLKIDKSRMKNVVVKNPDILPENVNDKFFRLDINLELDGILVDIEMQVGREDAFGDRILNYWAAIYSGTLKKGDDYSELLPCISLAFVDFNMFPNYNKFHYKFKVLEESLKFPLSDKLSIHICELRKVPEFNENSDSELLWLNLLNAKSEEEIEKMVQVGTTEIKNAATAWHNFNADDRNRELARGREQAARDRYLFLNAAKEEGAKAEREKWEVVVAEKDDALAKKDDALATQAELIRQLQEQLKKNN